MALVIERRLDAPITKFVERSLGVGLGVLVAAVLFHHALPTWALATTLAVAAGARAFFRQRSYLCCSAVSTLPILAVIGAGRPIARGLLAERMLATLAGVALMLAANRVCGWLLPKQVQT